MLFVIVGLSDQRLNIFYSLSQQLDCFFMALVSLYDGAAASSKLCTILLKLFQPNRYNSAQLQSQLIFERFSNNLLVGIRFTQLTKHSFSMTSFNLKSCTKKKMGQNFVLHKEMKVHISTLCT